MAIFNSLGSNYNLRYVLRSLLSDISGQKVKLKNFLQDKYGGKAILAYKGREALTFAFKILDLPQDSCVAINGFTCYTVYKSVHEAGLVAICLDLDEENSDLNFTVENLKKTLEQNKNIKVVIVQNTLGAPCDIEKIAQICKEEKLYLIEDLPHCVGAKYPNGKEAGTVGDFACLSFSQDKLIDAVSGGALIIRNKKYRKFQTPKFKNISWSQQFKDRFYPLFTSEIRSLYDLLLGKILHYFLKKMDLMSNPMSGSYDCRLLPDWYCNLALMEFRKLKTQLNHRRKIARIYAKTLNKKILNSSINNKISLSANLRFSVFVNNRKDLIKFLKKSNIFVSDIWYSDVAPECPNAVEISHKILNLPTHINVSNKDALRISERINTWLKSQ